MASIREIFEQNKGRVLARQPAIVTVAGAKRIPVARRLKFGTAKRALRSMLEQSGTKIRRTPPNSETLGSFHYYVKHPIHHIEVPRGGVGPVNTALHEAGHSVDSDVRWREAPLSRFFRSRSENEKLDQAMKVTAEVRADKLAMNHLRKVAARPSELARWKKDSKEYIRNTFRIPMVEQELVKNNSLKIPTISEVKRVLRERPWLQKSNTNI